MDNITAILRQELAAMDPIQWNGAGPVSVLETGDLGVDGGLWPQCTVKKVGVKGKEWSVLPDCGFDRVVLHRAVEVCEWPDALLDEVWRVVRPDGLVILVLPRDGTERFNRSDVLAMLQEARLKVVALEVGGKESGLEKFVPWLGSAWLVLAVKDVLNVRPLGNTSNSKNHGPLVRPVGMAG